MGGRGRLLRLFDLTGRTALVTGASRGLGKAISRAFAEAGCNVVASARSVPQNVLEEISFFPRLYRFSFLTLPPPQEILVGTGARGHSIEADLLRREESSRLANEALAWARGDCSHPVILCWKCLLECHSRSRLRRTYPARFPFCQGVPSRFQIILSRL